MGVLALLRHLVRRAVAMVLGAGAILAPWVAPADGPGPEPAAPAPVRRALLIGVGEYPLLKQALPPETYEREIRLQGPENDVVLMREVLGRVAGFRPEHLRTLAGWGEDETTRPTRAAILAGLAELAEASGPGDFVLIYFAGHGTQQPVRRADPLHEPDGLDEVLLPADAERFEASKGGIPGAILDDELGEAARAIRDKGAQVWLIVDACHSATLLRGESGGSGMRMRGVEPSLLGAPPANLTLRSGGGTAAPPSPDLTSIVAFHGAQSYGRAPELDVALEGGETRRHGLFTWLLAQELVRTGGHASYRELLGRVVAAYQAWPCHLTVPGGEGDLDRDIWSGAEGGGRWLVSRTPEEELRLDRGLLAGVGVGARLELSGEGEGAQGLAKVQVVDAGPFEARCELFQGELPEGKWSFSARLLSRPLPDVTLPWSLVDEQGGALDVELLPEATRRRLLEDPQRAESYPFVSPDRAAWWLVHDGATWRLRARGAEGGLDHFLAGPASLDRALMRLARARNLVGFAGAGLASDLPDGLEVWVEMRRGGRGAPRRVASGEVLTPGDELRIRARKRSSGIVDLNVFFVDSQHGILPIFPRRGTNSRLGADVTGELTLLDWVPLIDTTLGIEHVLVIAQSRGSSESVLDLGFLAQDEIPRLRSGADPYAELLSGIARAEPTRGVGLSMAQSAPLGVALTTLRLDWPDLAAPAWPRESPLVRRGADGAATGEARPLPELELPAGLPSPFALGQRTRLTRSPGSRGGCDVILSGPEDGPAEWVLVDLGPGVAEDADPALVLATREFSPRAAFRFEPGRRIAYYARRAGAPFDMILIDGDGDGLAEERWVREGEEWRREARLAIPWLSQTWAGVEGEVAAKTHAARVFSVLSAGAR